MTQLTNLLTYPFNLLQSCVCQRDPLTCTASTALAIFGSYVLYRYLNPSISSTNLRSTNLRTYVVVTPYEGNFNGRENLRTKKERQELFIQAKKIIKSLPRNFRANVDFNDRKLEIGFKYGMQTLSTLVNHHKLWFILSGKDTFQLYSETIFNWRPNRFCVQNLDTATLQLHREQEAFKKKVKESFAIEVTLKSSPNFKELRFSNYADLLSAIFKQAKGVSVGDFHRSIAPKYFMASQMHTFVSNNVEILFMEGLCEDLQEDLDAYFDSKTDVESIPLSIKYKFGYIEEILKSRNGYTFIDIIKIAKIAGIKRIVAIDTELSIEENDNHCNRVSTMNYFAKGIIEREMPKGNYLIFSGVAHAITNLEFNTPSFSQLFGIPSILIQDGYYSMIHNTQNQEITINFQDNSVSKLHPNFSIQISSEESQKK